MELSSWGHRFDDPRREYRTLYCAQRRVTCFRETLADFRPNTKAIAEYRSLFGEPPPLAGTVPRDWIDQRALAPGRIVIRRGELIGIDTPAVRREFESRYAELLAAHGMEHLDITELRSRDRIVSQTLGRFVFENGGAGVIYRSNLDDLLCAAVFEGKARLTPDGEPEPLASSPRELARVCKELGLVAANE
jgi:hypothetical protein